jgi:uncharacterized membrane protein YozB (DUF420 family)
VIESGAPAMPTALRAQTGAALNASVFLGIALTIAFVVAFGFGQTFNSAVVRPRFPLPAILYVHIGLFAAWVVLFVTQAAFIRFNRRKWHRQLGFAGIAVGTCMPFVGVATAVLMAHFHVATGHPHAASSLAVPFSDMVAFGIAFGLAVFWRRKPSFHARLMLLASCALTGAAFARFPAWLVPNRFSYVAVELLVMVAMALDWLTTHRIHPVFGYGLPWLAGIHATAMWLFITAPRAWVAIAHAMMRTP